MKTAKIYKEVNSIVYTIAIYINSVYTESVYCRYKYQAKQYCKENNLSIVNTYL